MAGKPSKRQIAYNEQINDLFDEYKLYLASQSEKVVEMLAEMSRRLEAKIFTMAEEDWLKMNLLEIQQELNKTMESFKNQYNTLSLSSLRDSSKQGVNVVIQPIKDNLDFSLMYGDPTIFTPAFMDDTIRAIWNTTNALITNATQDASARIIQEIAIGISTGEPRWKVVENIIGELKGEKAGFVSLNSRAWTIYRTETSRMYSISSQIQMSRAVEFIPQAEKTWHHGVFGAGRFARPGHQALDGVSIPFNDFFYNEKTQVSLLYPHAPLAPISEVANCGCAHTLKMPDESFLRDKTLINV